MAHQKRKTVVSMQFAPSSQKATIILYFSVSQKWEFGY